MGGGEDVRGVVQHQRWYVELFQIVGDIGFGERFDALIRVLGTACMLHSQNWSSVPCETFAPGRLAPWKAIAKSLSLAVIVHLVLRPAFQADWVLRSQSASRVGPSRGALPGVND